MCKCVLKVNFTGLWFVFVFWLDNYARRTPNIKNSTDGYKQDAAGIRRAVAALPANIFNNPNQACYTQFFGNGQPPTGLRTANLANMRYICQQVPAHAGTYFYATMFDEGRGIPVYSAYALNANNVNFVAQAGGGWIQTNGNLFTYTLKLREKEEWEILFMR